MFIAFKIIILSFEYFNNNKKFIIISFILNFNKKNFFKKKII